MRMTREMERSMSKKPDPRQRKIAAELRVIEARLAKMKGKVKR